MKEKNVTKNAFALLPLGAVKPLGYLKTQCTLQADNITRNMELYDDFNGNSAWLGAPIKLPREDPYWERGSYYARGLVALAYVTGDAELLKRAKKWVDWTLNNQKTNGDFGINADMWARMPMLCAVRDYYEAELIRGHDDKRVLPFFERYFKWESRWRYFHRLTRWAHARGADNVEAIVWYRDTLIKNGAKVNSVAWLESLAKRLLKCTQDWEKEMRNGGAVRYHIVNTTQGYKHPYVKYRVTGDKECLKSLKKGLESIRKDHGRIDNLPNADEAPRDNLPTRGSETCSVAEGIFSLQIGGAVSGDSELYDIMEGYAYNNLPNCFGYDINGYSYFQVQNQVLMTAGYQGFDYSHGDDSAIGISGYSCCFSNLHMGYPKFVQSLFATLGADTLVACAYGASTINTTINGKKVSFTEETGYPYNGKVKLTYSGENAVFKLKLRVPKTALDVKIDGVRKTSENGWITLDREWKKGDILTVEFTFEIKISDWHHNSKYVSVGPVLYCLPIKEDWRVFKNAADFKELRIEPKGNMKNTETYPCSEWRYSFDKADFIFEENVLFNPDSPISPENYPCSLKGKFNFVMNWHLDGNVCDTVENADFSTETEEKRLIPTAFSRLKISVFPKKGSLNTPEVKPETDTALIKKIQAAANSTTRFATEIISAYKMKEIVFPVRVTKEFAVVWGVESGKYTHILKQSEIKSYGLYKTSFTYRKNVKLNKVAFETAENEKVYACIAILDNGEISELSEEVYG